MQRYTLLERFALLDAKGLSFLIIFLPTLKCFFLYFSEDDSRLAARRMAREIQKVMGATNVRMTVQNFEIKNIMASCRLPFRVKVEEV